MSIRRKTPSKCSPTSPSSRKRKADGDRWAERIATAGPGENRSAVGTRHAAIGEIRGLNPAMAPPALVASFPPQVGAGCRVLVLGTVPSMRSLHMRQSFAHPHNLFWPFMGTLFDAGVELPYAERIARLHAAGIGIWDVLKQCERPGSLDSSIRAGSEVANDIPALLDA